MGGVRRILKIVEQVFKMRWRLIIFSEKDHIFFTLASIKES